MLARASALSPTLLKTLGQSVLFAKNTQRISLYLHATTLCFLFRP